MNISKDGGKKVLIFSTAYLPFIGGAELAVKEITGRLDSGEFSAEGGPAFGWDMITARLDRKLLKYERMGNINVYRIGPGIPTIDKYWLAFFGHRFAQKLHEKNRYNLIWSIMASYSGFAAMFFKKRNPNIPFLLTLQEGDDLEYIKKRVGFAKLWFGRIFASADYIQCISRFLADWAKQNGATCSIEVVPNGVDINKIKNKIPTSPAGRSKIKNKEEKIIITTSRLVHKNGIDVLIKAAAELKKIAPDLNFKIQILGAGPDEKKLKDLAKELKVDEIVQFLGHIEPEKVYDYLAKADIFARPSRSEGLGSSFLEAMGAGLPIIGTAIGGIPDFLKDPSTSTSAVSSVPNGSGQVATGLFTKVDDPQDLALKIKKLITDEELARQMAESGRQLVLEKYDWNFIAEKMKNIFNRLHVPLGGMRILIATGIYPPDIGGPAKYAKNLTSEFLRRGHAVNVLSYRFEKKLPIGIRHLFYFFRIMSASWRIDLIIALDIFSTGFPAVLTGKIFGKKTILRVGGDFLWETYIEATGNLIKFKDFYEKRPPFSLKFKIIAFLQKLALKNAFALAFNSYWQKEFFEMVYHLDAKKSFVIENFYPVRKIISNGIYPAKNFLFAGRRIKFKNLELLEEIFEELKTEGSEAKLEIIDNLSREDLREKIKNSYALITVSISDFAPNFIIEGISADKPFILTKECGLTDKLNGLGVFVDPFDRSDIKKAILSLMDKDNYNRYKERITAFNFTHSWKEIADEFLNIYKKMPTRGGSAFGGKVLMISMDKNIFDENSEVRQRMIEYGRLADKLHIVIFTKKSFNEQKIGNVFLYPTNSRNKLFCIFDAIKIGKKILAAGGQWLVTSQDVFETGLVGWRLAKRFKLPWQAQIHTDFLSPYFKKESALNNFRVYLAKFLIKRTNCIRVVSERIKSSLLQATSYKLQAKTIVLPIFIDIEKIKNIPIKTDLRKKYPQFDFIILMASRLTKEKNILLAIDAMVEVVKQYPKTGLVIIGDGPEKTNLIRRGGQITNHKSQTNIVLESWTNNLSSYYKTADLFLLTSNYEGYGRTIIEAASVGCKIISSEVGIANEILPRENIFEPGNKEQLKEKIIKAIKGEIKPVKLLPQQTRDQYLQAYKKSWENCEFVK